MSDQMDQAIIRMPILLAMENNLSKIQFYNRAQAILTERDEQRETIELLRYTLERARNKLSEERCDRMADDIDKVLEKL